ncbi:hypothetical protein [uncultured Jatrophihabitans sp.]|uniref:hypothetical protein n=1 Tax=uncultured Jatrophihabitans sp. TaxID=1610747 RepID=UPI0035CAB273
MPHRRRTAARLLAAGAAGLAVCTAVLTTGLSAAAAAGAPWGDSGAQYAGGIVCALPGGVRVPMARWTVDGAPGAPASVAAESVYALADITERNGVLDPAPVTGSPAPMAAGVDGLDASEIAAAAYLIAHGSSGSADVAETSAVLAAAAGGGAQQARCLGQQGTSARRAAARWASAQRYAGPYTVALGQPSATRPGSAPTVSATVTSAAGVPTPGLTVQFAAAGQTASARTDRAGVARVRFGVGAPASTPTPTPVVASVSEPTGLTVYGSDPPSVAPAAPSTYQDTGSLVVVAHPHPTVSIAVDHPLLLANGVARPSASVTGTYGYSGAGTITLLGPARTVSSRPCSTLTAADFAAAAPVWTATFQFAGDGAHAPGATPPLAAGCYALEADVLTTNSDPPAKASAAFSPAATVTVSGMTLSTSTGPGVAAVGALSATVTATNAGQASVQSTLTEYGPLASHDGACDALDWSHAPVVGKSAAATLTPAAVPSGASSTATPAAGASGVSGGASVLPSPTIGTSPPAAAETALTADIHAPAASRVGCYALAAHSVITLDGHTLTTVSPIGGDGSTTSVLAPTLTVTNASYDGQQGAAMSGSVTISGAYRFAGAVSIALVSAPVPFTGCRAAVFAADPQPEPGQQAKIVDTTGDGSFSFVTPIASQNRCYAVTAALTLSANPAVRVSATPSAGAVFLAGVALNRAAAPDVPSAHGSTLAAALITLGIAALLVLGVALVVIAGVAVSRGRSTWSTFRPELRLDDELPESRLGTASPAPAARARNG